MSTWTPGYRYYTAAELKQFAQAAAASSCASASRQFGVSRSTIRRAMEIHKIPQRRPGNFTVAEAKQLKGWTPTST